MQDILSILKVPQFANQISHATPLEIVHFVLLDIPFCLLILALSSANNVKVAVLVAILIIQPPVSTA